MRAAIRRRGFSIKTEQSYLHWILRFLGFLGDADPRGAGAPEIGRFLDGLAVHRRVSGSTQNLALNALVFLYRETLGRSDLDIGAFTRARRPKRLRTVLTHAEVALLLRQISGTQHLMVSLMYGTGMRLMECSRLRVQDIDFGYGQITVRNAKGGKDSVVPLPEKAAPALRDHLERVKALHETDLAEGFGEVYLRPMRWRGSIRTPPGIGGGSTCFRARACQPTPVRVRCGATICTKTVCRRR